MGTRSDYYVLKNNELEWIGSYGWDGYPDGEPKDYKLHEVKTEQEFKNAINKMIDEKGGYKEHWPWPWEDSSITDYFYIYYDGKVYVNGEIEIKAFLNCPDEEEEYEKIKTPLTFKLLNMKASGVIVIG